MLMDKKQFVEKNPDFSIGMHAYGRDNESLGRVIAFDDQFFTIEKGVFFPKDFTFRYSDVSEIRDNKLYINQSKSDLKEWKNPQYTGWTHVDQVNTGLIEPSPVESFRPKYESLSEEMVKVPVYEEEIDATKTASQTGEVRVKKIVHTELKHLTVPLSHEEIRIERVNFNRPLKEGEGQDAFQERTMSMPVMDEDVRVGKHTVLKEKIQLKKGKHTEQRDVADRVRSEEVEIQREDMNKKKKVG